MFPGFVRSILDTPKQRSRFFWIRSMVAGASGFYAGHLITGTTGVAIGFAVAALSFYTLAPVVALVVCFVEQMLS